MGEFCKLVIWKETEHSIFNQYLILILKTLCLYSLSLWFGTTINRVGGGVLVWKVCVREIQ